MQPQFWQLLWVHVCTWGGRCWRWGMAHSSADSFKFLSLVQTKSIRKLSLRLSLANHAPLETSLRRFPGWLVCGLYRCN